MVERRPSSNIDKLQVDDKQYLQPTSISNVINNYFCNIPIHLASKLPKPNRHFASYLKQKREKRSKFRFMLVNEIEVFLLLDNLDGKKSFGVDKLHPYLASVAAFQIFRPVTYIINLSIKQGIFPDNLKIAKVIPIFKQGSRLLCDNYRPISVLPTLSKIFEKCIYHQLISYFSSENIIIPNQYGFKPGSTTMDCLVDLIEEIYTSLDQGNYAVSIFLDLSKAFDTVNDSILLSKLLFYGIQNPYINWFKSYLNKRKQRVFVNGTTSDTMPISSGVPQGSILGPLLFLIYINDFTQASNFFSMRLFADDTSLTVSGKNLDEILLQINNKLPNIYDWLCANKLTLNLRKTKYLIFQPRQKVNCNLLPPLSLAGQPLEQACSIKYLGIYIDSHLSWHDHIDYVCDKVSKSINIMTKVKRYLGNKSLTSIYYSLIYPYLIYGCLLWGNNYDNPLSQLIRLQNKAVRIINDVPLRDHITPHYVNLGLLKFRDIVKMYTCLFMYEYVCENKPCNFSIPLVLEQHNYSTRSASNQKLHLPHSRINIRKFCPTVIGKYYWNDLPLFIRDNSSKVLFKKALFKYYFAQY